VDVRDTGEFALIERLRALLPAPETGALVVGIGDDAAVWRAESPYVAATTDTLVAGVHFLPGRVSWSDVGWKALAVNISVIAAMGAAPAFALVTLALPPETPLADVEALYRGLGECAGTYDVAVAGGDVVAAPVFSVTVALTGRVRASGDAPVLLRRDAAQPGDVVGVTGALGGSAGGLRLLQGGAVDGVGQALVQRHMRIRPRVDAGEIAVKHGVRCAIDISDGLAQDLGHVCRASGVDAEVRIDRLPLAPGLAEAFPEDARFMAVAGGEDYELALVAPEDVLREVDAALRAQAGMPDGEQVTIVGRITGEGEGRVRVVDERGAGVELARRGWDHLRR
jgi:thiamine-monophosphate kinase